MGFKLNNKKGISFFSLIIPILLAIISILYITHINNNNSVKDEIYFGNTLKEVDLIQSRVDAENEFRKDIFKNLLNDIDGDYLNKLFSDKKLENDFEISSLTGCSYNNLDIWYNEKIIDNIKNEGKNNNDEDEEDEDESINNENNKDNENIKINEINDDELESNIGINCLPDFKNDFKISFKEYLENRIKNEVELSSDIQDFKDLKIDVQYSDEKNDLLKIQISSIFEGSTENSIIKKKLKHNYEFKLGTLPELITTLEKVLPKLSENFKENIPLCIEKNQNNRDIIESSESIEKYCFEKSFKDLISKEDGGSDLLNEYGFSINNYEDFNKDDNKEYYVLNVIINDLKNNNEVLNFLVVLKDNIPYSKVSFSLLNSNLYDNVIEVDINKPSFKVDNNDKYIIIYGYQNFLNNIKLKDLLNNKKLSLNFNQLGYKELSPVNVDDIFYLKKDSEFNDYFDVDLAVVSNSGFSNGVKKVLLYQKYNNELDKFELLKNKELFVYVFAVDKNNNYYIENFDEIQSKFILPISNLGPTPIKKENINLNSNIQNYENSLILTTNNYESNKFVYYDLYIFKDRGEMEIKPECNGVDYKCYYYSGRNSLTNLDLNLLITSDQYAQPTNENQLVIGSHEFKPINDNILFLENGEEYELFIAPIDSNGNFISKTQMSFKEPNLRTDEFSYQFPTTSSSILLNPSIINFRIEDNKGPNPINSLEENRVLSMDSNNYLVWDYIVVEGFDVKEVRGKLQFTRIDGSITNPIDVIIRNDKYLYGLDSGEKIQFNSQEYSSAILNNILPVDSKGNIDETYDGILYSARLG